MRCRDVDSSLAVRDAESQAAQSPAAQSPAARPGRPVLDRREHWVRRIWVAQTAPGQRPAGYLAPGFRLAHEWRLAGGATAVWLYTKGPAGGVTPGRARVL